MIQVSMALALREGRVVLGAAALLLVAGIVSFTQLDIEAYPDPRFRVLMMTALVDGLGLLPAALSTSIGAQAQRPLALVVIGVAISIVLLTRVFDPTLVYLLAGPLRLSENRSEQVGSLGVIVW